LFGNRAHFVFGLGVCGGLSQRQRPQRTAEWRFTFAWALVG
jgi:hypothetical protein